MNGEKIDIVIKWSLKEGHSKRGRHMKDDMRQMMSSDLGDLRQLMLHEFDECAGLTRTARANLEILASRQMYLLVGGDADGDQMRLGYLTTHIFLRAAAPHRFADLKHAFEPFYNLSEAGLAEWLLKVRGLIADPNNLQPLKDSHPLNSCGYQAAWTYIKQASERVRLGNPQHSYVTRQEMARRYELLKMAVGAP